MQLAEPAPEGEVLLRRDVLVAEEDHEVFRERAMDLIRLAVGEQKRVGAGDLRADDRREFLDADGLVRLLFAGGVAIARALLARE